MTEEQNASDQLFQLLGALSQANVRFVVCGGVACVLQGVERATYDLDLAVDFDRDNLERLLQVASRFGLVPRAPVAAEALLEPERRREWLEEKGALVFTFDADSGPLQLDIFLDYPISWETLSAKADVFEVAAFQVDVSSKADLLAVKEAIDPLRPKDRIDIEELKRLLEDEER